MPCRLLGFFWRALRFLARMDDEPEAARMSDEFGKELLMLGGTIAGFIAALLTVREKRLALQKRL